MRTEVARASAKITASRKPTCAALDKQIARQEARVSKLEAEAEEARKQEAARRDAKLASIDADTERRKKENAARLDTRREQRRAKALEREICSPPAPRTPKEERKPKRSLRRSRARVADEGVVTQLKGCDDMCGVAMDQSLVCGAKTTILLSSSGGAPRTIPARFCLVDARTLVPSHDPETFDARPEYPAGVQEREYKRDRNEQLKIIGIAQNPKPEAIISTSATPLEGTPIVTREGIVLGGNGRTMGVQLHYRRGGQAFATYIRQNALDFGLRPGEVDAAIAGERQPIVVRVVDLPRVEWSKAVRDFNTGLTQAMDQVTESVAIARQLSPSVFEVLARHLAGDDVDLGEFLASKDSSVLVDALRRTHIINQTNQNRLLRSDGRLSDDARQLLVRALGAAVVPDAELLELVGPELRTSLARSAAYWLAASAFGGAWDVRAPMAKALRDLLAIRTSGLSLRRWRQQQAMFEPPATAGDPLAERLLVILVERPGPVQMTRIAKPFASSAAFAAGSQRALVEPPTPVEALDAAARAAGLDLVTALG